MSSPTDLAKSSKPGTYYLPCEIEGVQSSMPMPQRMVAATKPLAPKRVTPLAEVTPIIMNQANEVLQTYSPAEFKRLLAQNHQFAPGTVVKGDLDLSDYHGATPLPTGLIVKGNFYLFHNPYLTTLPDGLRVTGNMNLFGNSYVKLLPRNLRVGGDLNLADCIGISLLPPLLRVNGNLNLYSCILLQTLPADIKVGGDINASGCRNLVSLPPNLRIRGNFNLSRCTRLAVLPHNLQVAGNLDLSNTNLVALTEDLRVGGILNLVHCMNLRSLSQGLYVEEDINLFGCRGIVSLPSWITTLGPKPDGSVRVIDLTDTSLSGALITRLREARAEGIQFHFSNPKSESTEEFKDLDAALEFWLETAHDPDLDLPQIHIENQLEEVLRFLERLTTTAEYQNKEARPLLGKRIIEVFDLMSQDNTICEFVVDLMYQGLASCDDRIISALQEIELKIIIDHLERNPYSQDDLRSFGRSFLLLELVNKTAAELIPTLGYVDEISVYLAFQIALAARFNLPIQTRNMIFRGCADVTDEQIAAFGDQIALQCTETCLDAFLKTWSPWIKHERRSLVPAFEALELCEQLVESEDTCLIAGVAPQQPILYAGNIYDYAEFVKWYVDKGTDPATRLPIDLKQLKRLNKNNN